jgi:hypothetical protein
MRRAKESSRAEFSAEPFHLGEGMLVAGTVGGGNALVEAGEGLIGTVEFGKRLGGHLVGGDVIRVDADERGELLESPFRVALADMLHGEAVAGESVVRVELKNFVECGDLVHTVWCGVGRVKGKQPRDLDWIDE